MVSILGINFGASAKKVSPYKEVGASGTSVISGYVYDRERNPKLKGTKKYEYFEDLLSNVSIISAGVRFYTTLISSTEWKFEPADDSALAQEYADFYNRILGEMQGTWQQTIRSSSLFIFNGFAAIEKTAKLLDDGKIGIHSLESRPCRTFVRWDVDDNGNINGLVQTRPNSGEEIYIPRSKLILLQDQLLSDSPEGFGLFRAVAESADRLKAMQLMERISSERNLSGIPIARAPLFALDAAVTAGEITEEQKAAALQGLSDMVTIIRKGEQTGMILDSKPYDSVSDTSRNISSTPQWGIELLTANSSGLVELDVVIRRLNMEIARILGVEMLLLGDGSTGSMALSQDKTKSLMLSINSSIKDIEAQFQKDLVPWIGDLNSFDPELLPRLVGSEVSAREISDLIAAMRDLSAAGLTLNRDDEASRELFQILGLTPLDPDLEVTPEAQVF